MWSMQCKPVKLDVLMNNRPAFFVRTVVNIVRCCFNMQQVAVGWSCKSLKSQILLCCLALNMTFFQHHNFQLTLRVPNVFYTPDALLVRDCVGSSSLMLQTYIKIHWSRFQCRWLLQTISSLSVWVFSLSVCVFNRLFVPSCTTKPVTL